MREVRLDDMAKEAVKKDKTFLTSMHVGEARAVVLRDGAVVMFEKRRDVGKYEAEMDIRLCPKSVYLDLNLAKEDLLVNE